MKLGRLLYLVTALVLVSALVSSAVGSARYWRDENVEDVKLEIEFAENQNIVDERDLLPIIHQWWTEQPDSNGLIVNAFLLETMLKHHPLVSDAQVYWNLGAHLRAKVWAQQAEAHVRIGRERHLLSTERELLPAPREVILDLPVVTGATDSAAAVEAGVYLDWIKELTVFESVAQLNLSGSQVEVVPLGWNHVVVFNRGKSMKEELVKLKAFYEVSGENKIKEIQRIDLRFKNQIVHR